MPTQIAAKVVETFHLPKGDIAVAEFLPLLPPDGDVGVGRALAIKLSHAAIVALGQIVDPAVDPAPVKIGSFSAAMILLAKMGVVPPARDPSGLRKPVVLEPITNSRTKVRACGAV